MQSQNNLKQIALAAHNCHDTFGTLPPMAAFKYGGAYYAPLFYHLLPYIEQQNVHKAATPVVGGGVIPLWETPGQGTQYLRQTRIKTYICPSDSTVATNAATDWTPGEGCYAANFQVYGVPTGATMAPAATAAYQAVWDGKTTLVGISDGTSNTIQVGEQVPECHDHTAGWWHYNGMGNAHASTSPGMNNHNTCPGSKRMTGR